LNHLDVFLGVRTKDHRTKGHWTKKTTKNANPGQKTTQTKSYPDKKPPVVEILQFTLMKFIMTFLCPKNLFKFDKCKKELPLG